MAKREFGGSEQVKEKCRDERRWAWMTGIRQDVVFGVRMMRRTPVVTLAAVLSLALGIGANTAIVSLMDVVLWRELPVPNPNSSHWCTGKAMDLRESCWTVHPAACGPMGLGYCRLLFLSGLSSTAQGCFRSGVAGGIYRSRYGEHQLCRTAYGGAAASGDRQFLFNLAGAARSWAGFF